MSCASTDGRLDYPPCLDVNAYDEYSGAGEAPGASFQRVTGFRTVLQRSTSFMSNRTQLFRREAVCERLRAGNNAQQAGKDATSPHRPNENKLSDR
jgi:hypothetical protein